MKLFGKSQPKLEVEPVNYDSVLEYLRCLSADDYTKLCGVADIYRAADQAAAAELGVEHMPTTFIDPPTSLLDEPLEFIDDEPKRISDITPKKL